MVTSRLEHQLNGVPRMRAVRGAVTVDADTPVAIDAAVRELLHQLIEANAIDDPATGNRVGIDLGATITAHFEGRGYTELWEVFAFAGDSTMTRFLAIAERPTFHADAGIPRVCVTHARRRGPDRSSRGR